MKKVQYMKYLTGFSPEFSQRQAVYADQLESRVNSNAFFKSIGQEIKLTAQFRQGELSNFGKPFIDVETYGYYSIGLK